MNIVEPKIFRIAETQIDPVGLSWWLKMLGAEDWTHDEKLSGSELLVEVAARRCYKAFGTELNPNLSKVREGNDEYLMNILNHAHGAVLEHAYVTYAIENVSRVFTHEMVRHRLCNFSQESLRFVRPTSLNAYFPNIFENIPNGEVKEEVAQIFVDTFVHLEDIQKRLVDLLGMDDVTKMFGDKKKLQSSMRRLMPIGMATGIVVTSNHRNWRHMLSLRTSVAAEEEIRWVFAWIASDMQIRHPNIYQDMYFDNDVTPGVVHFENEKV